MTQPPHAAPTIREGLRTDAAVSSRALAAALWAHAAKHSRTRGPIPLGPHAWIAHRGHSEPAATDPPGNRIPAGYHLLTGAMPDDLVRQTDARLDDAIDRLAGFLTTRGVPR